MKFALGTVQLGMDYGIQGGKQPSGEMADGMLSSALEHGIRHFDTAAAYGNAETVLGGYRKDHPDRARGMRIISKLAPDALAGKPSGLWKDIVLRRASESMERLHVPELEAFLFHNAKYIFDEKAVRALDHARREGLAEKTGVSVYTPQEAMQALEYDEIKVIQIPYNVFDQRLDRCGFFGKAGQKGMEVYARSSLLQGLILMDPDALPEKMRFAQGYLKRFLSICREWQVPPLKAAVCCVGRHQGIDYVVFGADNRAQMSEYLAMREGGIPDGLVEILRKEFEGVEEKLVNPVLWQY